VETSAKILKSFLIILLLNIKKTVPYQLQGT
jgi:hypothetical protein